MLARVWGDWWTAVEFLTRLPVPGRVFDGGSLARSMVFFPVVGWGLGALAGGLDVWLSGHVGRWVAGFLAVAVLVVVTGALHEDGLADAADGFGGGWTRERTLEIFRDSRIGSYGAAALGMSLLGRVLLLATIPVGEVVRFAIAAEVLCRWTLLPLGFALPPARREEDGQGSRVAARVTSGTMVAGTLLTILIVGMDLRGGAVRPVLVAALVALTTGLYYRRRLGGVTGDCFGATAQVTEIAVLLCGVWRW